jgi:hypothetical protein
MKLALVPIGLAAFICGCSPVGGQDTNDSRISKTNTVATATAPAGAEVPNTNVPPAVASAPTIPAVKPPPDLPIPAQEVVKLAQSTLGEGVLLGYIANIREPFSLSADQIIYLNDLGLSNNVIQALLKRGHSVPGGDETLLATGQNPDAPVVGNAASDSGVLLSETAGRNVILTNYLASTAPGDGDNPLPGGIGPTPSVTYNTTPPTNYVVAQPQPPAEPVTTQVFQESLSPYGAWVETEDYGMVWQPTVAMVNVEWRPYCDGGYWVWSDAGWYWNSTYTWGWAPFHYGRWCHVPHHGWCWTPDTVWGPAWVSWRTSSAHCGWAPLPPHCVWSPSIGFTYYGRHVGYEFGFNLGGDAFVYLGWHHFCDPAPWRRCVGRSEVAAIHAQSRVVNDIRGSGNNTVNIHGNNNTVVINNGPGLAPVQKATRGEIPKVTLAEAKAPNIQPTVGRTGGGANTVLPVYRPNLAAVSAARPTVASAGISASGGIANRAIRPSGPAPGPSGAGANSTLPVSRPYLAVDGKTAPVIPARELSTRSAPMSRPEVPTQARSGLSPATPGTSFPSTGNGARFEPTRTTPSPGNGGTPTARTQVPSTSGNLGITSGNAPSPRLEAAKPSVLSETPSTGRTIPPNSLDVMAARQARPSVSPGVNNSGTYQTIPSQVYNQSSTINRPGSQGSTFYPGSSSTPPARYSQPAPQPSYSAPVQRYSQPSYPSAPTYSPAPSRPAPAPVNNSGGGHKAPRP